MNDNHDPRTKAGVSQLIAELAAHPGHKVGAEWTADNHWFCVALFELELRLRHSDVPAKVRKFALDRIRSDITLPKAPPPLPGAKSFEPPRLGRRLPNGRWFASITEVEALQHAWGVRPTF